MAFLHFWRSRQTRSNHRRVAVLRVEALEDRSVPTVGLHSALGVGNDTGHSSARDVATDAAGNSYMTGSFAGTVDFDPANSHTGDIDILTSLGAQDIYVAKYDADNALIWAQRMGGDDGTDNFPERGYSLAVDASGNVYITGGFVGSADFGATTLTCTGTNDGFLTKLDANGSFQWARGWGFNGGITTGEGVGVDGAGNVYAVSVRFTYGHDFLKYTPSGDLVWNKSIATNSLDQDADLAVDGAGNLYAVGDFKGTVDFDPGPRPKLVSASNRSVFTLKLTTNGQFGWVAPFLGMTVGSTNGTANAFCVALDGSGNVIVGGNYSNTVDFDPGKGVTTLPTTGGGYIAKLNSSGGLAWVRATGGVAMGLAVDSAGSIYATGGFSGTVDFDPGAGVVARTSAGGMDAFVLKLTSAGNFTWVETFGAAGADQGRGVAVDATGTIHLAGSYQGTVDFDPGPLDSYWLTNSGMYNNAFLVLLTQP